MSNLAVTEVAPDAPCGGGRGVERWRVSSTGADGSEGEETEAVARAVALTAKLERPVVLGLELEGRATIVDFRFESAFTLAILS
jgi:hypothetical protein